MNPTLTFLALAIALPAAIAAILLVTFRRVLPVDLGQRYSAPLSFGIASAAGYTLTGAVVLPPDRHWHWIPPLALATGFVGGIAAAKSLWVFERLVLWLLASLVAAWLIVPNWASLAPPRAVWVAGLVTGLTLLTAILEPLTSRIPAPSRLFSYALAAVSVAVLTAAFLSLTYGKLAIVPAASLVGCYAGSLVGRGAPLQGLGLPYAIVVGGCAFVGTIDPPEPMWLLLLVALSPVALWCTAVGPAAQLRGWSAVLARLGSVVAILALSAAGLVATVGLP